MALALPVAESALNSPSHSLLHRQIAIDTAASEQSMVINSSDYVGIGTTTPDYKLEVVGSFRADNFKTDEVTAHTVFIGDDAGGTGTHSTAVGEHAGEGNTGDRQTATGMYAGQENTGDYQTATGFYAGQENTGDRQTALGYYAGYSNSGTYQTATGFYAGQGNTGHRVSGFGYEATKGNSGDDVVAIGYRAGKDNTVDNQFIVQQANINAIPLIQGDFSTGYVGIGTTTPTAALHLKAGTTAASTAPLKFTDGPLLTTPEEGTIEFADNKFCITNVLHQRAIDRTSDVAVATVTVANTTDETLLYTAVMNADSLVAGNMFKFHCDGIIQNDGAASTEEVTLRIKVGGVTVATLNPTTKAIAADSHWHIDANATQRTIGASGSRAIHIDLNIDDVTEEVTALATIDTTADMDVTVTAQWASADANNTISLYQGFMSYKN